MDRRNLPGFVWDEQRNRYFRIQPDHFAAPGSLYSRSAVRAQRGRRANERVAQRQTDRTARETVLRNRLLSHQLLGQAVHAREVGSLGPFNRERVGAAGATTLNSTQSLAAGNPFVFEETTNTLFYAIEHGIHQLQLANRGYYPSSHDENQHGFGFLTSSISSICMSPAKVLCATSAGEAHPPEVSLTALIVDDEVDGELVESAATIVMDFDNMNTIYCSSANQFKSPQSSFLVGSTDTLMLIENDTNTWAIASAVELDYDPVAVAWLSQYTAAVCLRQGGVSLWDIRTKMPVERLRGLAATNLQCHDGNSIATRGADTVADYDLRFAKIENSRPIFSVRLRSTLQQSDALAVSEDSGLLAYGDFDGTVKACSLRNGDLVTSRKHPSSNKLPLNNREMPSVGQIQFATRDKHRHHVLFASYSYGDPSMAVFG